MTGAPLIGRTLAGYRIEAEIGRGGQGVVYRATQVRLARAVALKIVFPQLAADDGFRERFRREGRSAASLEHPNVIPVYEAGEADGLAYLAIKYVEGPSLDRLLRTGPLPPARAIPILRQLAAALDHAAAAGVVHRDVKPANILLDRGDHAYLTDFGLSKAVSGAGLTRTGTWLGTLEYMAPEQIRGQPVTPAADRYALAAVAVELLTGRPPFETTERTALLYAHLHDPPPIASARVGGIGPRADAVLARGLAKSPDDRHPSAAAFVQALEAALARAPRPTATAESPITEPAGAGPPPPRRGRRWVPWAIGGGVVAAIGGVVAGILLSLGGGTEAPPPPEPFPTAAESALLAHVPSDTRDSCTRTGAEAAPGAGASVSCSRQGARVRYESFPTRDAEQADYARVVDPHVTRSSGDCPERIPSEDTYTHDRVTVGRWACYLDGGQATIVWAHDGLMIVSTMRGGSRDMAATREIWTGAGPE
jgi:protein kinase-like protein